MSQLDRSGHWILQQPEGKSRKNLRFPQENTGNQWNVEAVFRPEFFRIFSGWLPTRSCRNKQELTGKKFENFPAEILLPRSADFRCFPVRTGPYSSTWRFLNFDLKHYIEVGLKRNALLWKFHVFWFAPILISTSIRSVHVNE